MSRGNTTDTDIHDRIKQARLKLGLTQTAIAGEIGISQQSWAAYESGKSMPPVDVLQHLAVHYDINPDWLITGKGSEERSAMVLRRTEPVRVNVPIYSAQLGAGQGIAPSEEIVGHGSFLEEWLRRVARIEPAKAFIAEVRGNSMRDLLNDGDLVLGQMTPSIDRQEAIYSVYLNGDLFIKYATEMRQKVVLTSENKVFPPIEVTPADEFHIIGRVVRRIVQ